MAKHSTDSGGILQDRDYRVKQTPSITMTNREGYAKHEKIRTTKMDNRFSNPQPQARKEENETRIGFAIY